MERRALERKKEKKIEEEKEEKWREKKEKAKTLTSSAMPQPPSRGWPKRRARGTSPASASLLQTQALFTNWTDAWAATLPPQSDNPRLDLSCQGLTPLLCSLLSAFHPYLLPCSTSLLM